MPLPYRRVHLRLFAQAPPGDSAELAAALAQHLAGYGHAQVHEHGRYWKVPEYLEFSVELAPQGTADECVTALRAIDPAGWSDDVWNRRPDGPALWHPSVCWASIWSQEAATPPPFADGDVVIILDCPTARRERIVDAEAVVCGHAAPVVDARLAQWSFAVRLDSGDTFMLSESELVATGRRATGGTAPTWISVTPDGQVTGFSTPSEH